MRRFLPKTLLKDVFSEIRHSLGRFLSLAAITALGVSFFAGIKASAPDMKHSADAYFDHWNMQDIQLYSTAGLDKEDLDAIKALPGVRQAQPQFTLDCLSKRESRQLNVRVLSLNNEQEINQPRLVEGRLPEAPDECLVEADGAHSKLFGSYQPGDRIRLYSATDEPLSDALNDTTFIVVGKAYNPNFLSYQKGNSTNGTGSLDLFIYVPDEAIKADYYTEIDITVDGAKELNTYSDAYFDKVEEVTDEIDAISQQRIAARLAAQQEKVDEARADMNSQLKEAQTALEAGKQKLDKSAEEISNGLAALANGKAELASSKAKLDAGWAEYNSNKQALEQGKQQTAAGIAQIEKAQAQLPLLQSQKQQLETALQMLPALTNGLNAIEKAQAEYEDLKDQLAALEEQNPDNPGIPAVLEAMKQAEELLDRLIAQLTDQPGLTVQQAIAWAQNQRNQILAQIGSQQQGEETLKQLDEGIASIQNLDGQLAQLKALQNQLNASQGQLDAAYQTLAAAQQQYTQGLAQAASSEAQLAQGQQQLAAGEKEFEQGEKEYTQKKEEGESKLDEAQQQVDALSKNAKWIVLDRMSHYSARDYEACADRMDGIASVFPVFFFLVAALVCMTTMTRMVDEQRSEIGTLKALGYSKGQIAFKYLAYAGLASVIGSVIGCAIGMVVFPYIIFTAWNSMYNLEAIRFVFQPGLALTASGWVIAVVLLATIGSIAKELRQAPAKLMRPKAAKAGSKILLERIPWLWRKISFMHKVTLRNLFRYKKRFFMTVIGIAGCSALLVAGFGLNDSISDIVLRQFDVIYHYNAEVQADSEENPEIEKQIASLNNIKDIAQMETMPVTVNYGGKDVSANMNIVDDPAAFAPFISFYGQNGEEEELSLTNEGVLLSVKTAEKMGLSKGDSFPFKLPDGTEKTLKIAGIFEQYIDHQIYLTRDLFDTLQSSTIPESSFLLILDSTEPQAENDLGSQINDLKGITSLTFYTSLKKNFMDMIASIKIIVVVLVLSAAALAFVVLYNLSNVNISERMREIATIKVLGFTEKEVNAYVNRESVILSLIGAVAGLFLGIWLHGMIMNLAEMDNIRFGRTINWTSFALALVLTMVFTLIVNWIMKFQLRKIEMVESLKAVE